MEEIKNIIIIIIIIIIIHSFSGFITNIYIELLSWAFCAAAATAAAAIVIVMGSGLWTTLGALFWKIWI